MHLLIFVKCQIFQASVQQQSKSYVTLCWLDMCKDWWGINHYVAFQVSSRNSNSVHFVDHRLPIPMRNSSSGGLKCLYQKRHSTISSRYMSKPWTWDTTRSMVEWTTGKHQYWYHPVYCSEVPYRNRDRCRAIMRKMFRTLVQDWLRAVWQLIIT